MIYIRDTMVCQEAKEEGQQEEAAKIVLRLLARQVGQKSCEEARWRITTLSLPTLEALSEALLDFSKIEDLSEWLTAYERSQWVASLVLRQLTCKLGQELSEDIRSQVVALPLPTLEVLSEALLDFSTIANLEIWLELHRTEEQ